MQSKSADAAEDLASYSLVQPSLVEARPTLPPDHKSTSFRIPAFSAALQEAVQQVDVLCADTLPLPEHDIDTSALLFRPLEEVLVHAASRPPCATSEAGAGTANNEASSRSVPAPGSRSTTGRKRGRQPKGRLVHAAAADLDELRSQWHASSEAAALVLHTVRLAAQVMPATKDMNYVPPVSTTGTSPGTSKQAADARLAKDELILRVSIFSRHRPDKLLQEVAVLGSQPLSVLLEALQCPLAQQVQAEHARAPSQCPCPAAAFLYIEGTFYVQQPAGEEGVDLSQAVRTFCSQHGIPAPPAPDRLACEAGLLGTDDAAPGPEDPPASFKAASMAATRFRDLTLRLGEGCGYSICHLGSCEHSLAFTDVRLLHLQDAQLASAYPLQLFKGYQKKRLCCICARNVADRITFGDKCALESPAFWCKSCYDSLHLSGQGAWVESAHKVFSYFSG